MPRAGRMWLSEGGGCRSTGDFLTGPGQAGATATETRIQPGTRRPIVTIDESSTLAALGLRALVTIDANGNPDAFGTLPAHIRVERYVSQDHVLPHAAMVVARRRRHEAHGHQSRRPPAVPAAGTDQFDNAEGIARWRRSRTGPREGHRRSDHRDQAASRRRRGPDDEGSTSTATHRGETPTNNHRQRDRTARRISLAGSGAGRWGGGSNSSVAPRT